MPAAEQMLSSGSAAPPRRPRVAVVIPTLDEEAPIGEVIRAVPRDVVDEIIVADSGSRDRTVERARAAGARVVEERQKGYGRACAAGAQAARDCDIIVFLDGDGSDRPEVVPVLLAPILAGTHDFVIGSRTRGEREPGSMNALQIAAGYLAGALTRLLYGVAYTDMCAFRAIRRDVLDRLRMREMTYGWNLEMQMRAARAGLRIVEIPVPHRRRIGGASKVSGTVMGTLKAGLRLGLAFARVAFERSDRANPANARD
ncbi:glycosyl hydrolase [Aliidongia dinghuensis]|uniref:Glycosyl hydrolase n=1 Tax=Aliidongia dinghuensis TaxID=1867774 RepID=A0A8J3E581_9PROT|nr:glycosyltransferase family 2 protein [Aliidongia dinghuensis]GGF44968.1 glycosyl hydrolase [Aliidongia dinghuensis]